MKLKRLFAALLTGCIVLSGSSITMFDSYAKEQITEEQTDDEEVLKENSWRYRDGQLIYNTDNRKSRSSYEYAWEYVDGHYMNDVGEIIEGATKKGIDVSQWQGDIDWEKVKEDGIDFVIIRCGYGDDEVKQDDKKWEYNVSECERLGIPYGVYIYSYAVNTRMALSEANHVLRLLEGHNPTYPVFFDMEEDEQEVLDAEVLGEIAETFCDKVAEAGYDVGIYGNKYWWTNILTDEAFDNPSWTKWVAQYNSECTYNGTYDIWQCASDGRVDGIEGNVDINFWMDSFGSVELPFTDVKESDWFYDSVAYVYAEEIMNGIGDGTKFAPYDTTTRAMIITMLYRLDGSPDVDITDQFTDVAQDEWYAKAVSWALEEGVSIGTGDGTTFSPDSPVTREQLATMLYRYVGEENYAPLIDLAEKYSDGNTVSDWAETGLTWAVEVGLITGKGTGNTVRLAPTEVATRAETATIFMRFCEEILSN